MVSKAEAAEAAIVGARLYGLDGKFQYGTDRPETMKFIPFALCLIKREVFEKIGFLPEEYSLGHEDIEFCEKAKRAGFDFAVADIQCLHLRNYSSMSLRSILLKGRGRITSDYRHGNKHIKFETFLQLAKDLSAPLRKWLLDRNPRAFAKLKRARDLIFY
jgi:GT2 family glycosyltransferase